jgi:hypothetical protein
LKPTGQIKLKNFDLFWGKNEYGKTLLIDSIVKILLGENSYGFSAIDRVDEFPEGYAYIKDESGKRWKLPEKGDLIQLTKLTAREFRNVFIIRNSDLVIPVDEEFEFYKNITGRLTGLRTPLIRSIKEKLQKMGNLTKPDSSATLSGSASSYHLKTRVKRAEDLIGEVKEFFEEAQRENLDKLEEQISKTEETEKKAALEINNLEEAQKREKYEEGLKAFESFVKTEEQLDESEIFNENDWQSWKDAERDLKRLETQHKSLSTKLEQTREKFEKKNDALQSTKREFEVLDGRKKIIDEEIRPKLRNYETKSKELASLQSRERFTLAFSSVFIILLAISLIGLAINNSPIFTLLTILFLGLALFFVAFKLLSLQKRGSIAALWREMSLITSKFELEASDAEQLLAKIQIFDDDYSKGQKQLKELETEAGVLKSETSRLADEELPKAEQSIKQAEDTINSLKSKSKVDNLKDYVQAFRMKQQQEKATDRFMGILRSHFGQKSKKASIEENLAYWKEKIAELEPYKDKSKEIQYSEKEVAQLKSEEQTIRKQREQLERKLADFRSKLGDIGKEVNVNIRPSENPLLCETLVDLHGISKILQEFADNVKDKTSTVLEVMKIFEEMEGKEERKVEQLFEDSKVSSYFKEITDGLYQKVEYVSDEEKIYVTTKTGSILNVNKLSGGAYDQLYLCIRLALGEKLLRGSKGFFIMDDPFIKADIDRLARQINVLKRLSEEGWQILYFTAKDEVKNALKEDFGNTSVGCHEIENMSS